MHHLLQERIQEGGGGHDSIEDARSAMRLAQLKFQFGPEFDLGPKQPEENLTETFYRRGLRNVLIDSAGACKRFAAANTDCDGVEHDEQVCHDTDVSNDECNEESFPRQ